MRTEWRLYQASEWETGKRAYYPMLDPVADRQIDNWTIYKLRSDARKVFVNHGPLKTAVHERASYSVGRAWLPMFQGEDTEWGALASDWLKNIWYQTGNLNGPNWNWWESLKIESRYLDVFGEIFIYKVLDPKTGFPRYQHIPPYRVDIPRASGTVDSEGKMLTGPYGGLKCIYGVIQNEFGAPVAYNVRGRAAEDDRQISVDQMIHVGEWEFVDQTRPIPVISHGILDMRDLMAVQTNEKRALEIASAIAVLESNPIGGIDINDPTNFIRLTANVVGSAAEGVGVVDAPGYQTDPNPLRSYKFSDNGEYKYFKAGTGSDVKAFQFERPSGETTAFMDRLGRNCINFIWPYDLIAAPNGANAAGNRTLWVRANKLTRDRQIKLYPGAKQRILFAIAGAIELGILPENDDWMQWEFSFPKKPSIDAGRDAQQDREDLKACVRTWSDIHAELGTDTETQAFRKAMDLVAMLTAKKKAEQIYEEQTGEPITLPDSYMFMFTPNASATASVTAEQEPNGETNGQGGNNKEEGAETGPSEAAATEAAGTEGAEEEIEKTPADEDEQRDLLQSQTP